jgi:hypothetical protein
MKLKDVLDTLNPSSLLEIEREVDDNQTTLVYCGALEGLEWYTHFKPHQHRDIAYLQPKLFYSEHNLPRPGLKITLH